MIQGLGRQRSPMSPLLPWEPWWRGPAKKSHTAKKLAILKCHPPPSNVIPNVIPPFKCHMSLLPWEPG
jgi:hypothetical protein